MKDNREKDDHFGSQGRRDGHIRYKLDKITILKDTLRGT